MNNARAILCLLTIVPMLSNCRPSAPPDESPAPVARVTLQPATQKSVSEILTAYGSSDYAVPAAHAIAIQAEAVVAAVLVAPGARVQAGQALLRLTPTPATQLELDKAARDAQVARTDQARLTRLRAAGLATDIEVDTAAAAADAALALSKSLAARQGAGVGWLRAPADGTVEPFNLSPGDLLAAGTTVLRIGNANQQVVRLGIEPVQLNRLQLGQRVELSAPGSNASLIEGAIESIDRRIDLQSHQLSVLVSLPPSSDVLPGALMQARVILATHAQAVVVPRRAINYGGAEPAVFVAEDGHGHRRAVRLGISDGDEVEVIDGLKAGEPVVVLGAYELEDGMAIQVDTPSAGGAAP